MAMMTLQGKEVDESLTWGRQTSRSRYKDALKRLQKTARFPRQATHTLSTRVHLSQRQPLSTLLACHFQATKQEDMAHRLLLALLVAAPLSYASPYGAGLLEGGGPFVQPSRHLQSRDACKGNTPTTRDKWCNNDINSDYYGGNYPDTGVTREYWFELTDGVALSPDGVSRYVQTINGTVPGPTIVADWGDNVVVHVKNSLTQSLNGTSIHFHGIRQKGSIMSDGVVGITQCPTIPGDTWTYRWQATQVGSSFYHSHFGLQAWEGVFGGIIINGPASANYDEDKGLVMLSDWSHRTPDELWQQAQAQGPPTLDNGLINGHNIWSAQGTGKVGGRWATKVQSGKSYRFRIVNTALDSHFKFSIDNHVLTVIAADFIPIKPYQTKVLNVGIAQRYDVIVHMDQKNVASDFWVRADPQAACSSLNHGIRGILHYDNSDQSPTTKAYSYVDSCDDEPNDKMVPIIVRNVDPPTYEEIEIAKPARNAQKMFRWYINSTTLEIDWSNPTLRQIYHNEAYTKSDAVISMPTANVWAYVIIETPFSLAHPIHLHGFDFSVLAQGNGTYQHGVTKLKLNNPMRRDVAMLPAQGHLVLGFPTDNPGAWLLHCHIGWHTLEGFALQFVVDLDHIKSQKLINGSLLDDTCNKWRNYAKKNGLQQGGSGI